MSLVAKQTDEIQAARKIEFIRKAVHICYRVVKVLFLLYVVGFVLLLAIKLAGMVSQGIALSSAEMGDFVLGLLTGLLTLGLLGLALSIFATISKNGAVFQVSVVRKIKAASAVLLVNALLQTFLSSSFISFVSMGALEFGYATVGDAIPINASGIVVAIIFYCLALVYEYGAYLQFVSDNTV